VLLDPIGLAVVAVQPDERARPELRPPLLIVGEDAIEAEVVRVLQLGERIGGDVALRVERRRAGDENDAFPFFRRRGGADRRIAVILAARLATDDLRGDGGRTVMVALAELLHEHNLRARTHVQLHPRDVRVGLHDPRVLAGKIVGRAGAELIRVAQHPQVDVDRRRPLATVVDLDGDHVARLPRQSPHRHARALDHHHPVVHRQVLFKRLARKNVRPHIRQVHVHVRAAARIICMRARETARRARSGEDVVAVDLQPQRVWRRPYERADAAVADRHPLLAPLRRLGVMQVRAGDERAVVNLEQPAERARRPRRQHDHRESQPDSLHARVTSTKRNEWCRSCRLP
jgi:hypothetical protein